MATAHVLFTHYHPKAESIRFETKKRGFLISTKDVETGSISLDLPRSSLVALGEGHRRLQKIKDAVERFVKKEDILRVDWSDELSAYCVELSAGVDLPGLDVDIPVLVSPSFRYSTSLLQLSDSFT